MGCDEQCARPVDHHPLRQWWTWSASASCHMSAGEQRFPDYFMEEREHYVQAFAAF